MNAKLSKKVGIKTEHALVRFKQSGGKVRCDMVFTRPLDPNKLAITSTGKSIKKPGDEFEMVFGMRKAWESCCRNNEIPKSIRTEVWTAFNNAYGFGECKRKLTLNGVPVNIKGNKIEVIW